MLKVFLVRSAIEARSGGTRYVWYGCWEKERMGQIRQRIIHSSDVMNRENDA